MIDFSKASAEVRALFDDVSDLNYLFLQLQLRYHHTDLYERKSPYYFRRGAAVPDGKAGDKVAGTGPPL